MPKMRWLLRWDDGFKVFIVHYIKELKDPSPSNVCVVLSGGGHLQLEAVVLKRFWARFLSFLGFRYFLTVLLKSLV